jgi:hypothetical protein
MKMDWMRETFEAELLSRTMQRRVENFDADTVLLSEAA